MTNFEDEQDDFTEKNITKKKSFFVSTFFLNSNNGQHSGGIIRSRSSNDIEIKSDNVNPSPETEVDLKMEHPVEKDNMEQPSSKS